MKHVFVDFENGHQVDFEKLRKARHLKLDGKDVITYQV